MIRNGRNVDTFGTVSLAMQLDSTKPVSIAESSELQQQGRSDRPLVVDLFAGAGGMSLGFEQAGFDIVAAVEIDPVHALIHRYNFPECAVLPRSVVGLSGKAIRESAGIGNKRVHVVIGGAPCQGFSLIGKRVLDDPRNSLVLEFVRIVTELEASHFVFENVKGLTLGDHRKFLDELIAVFDTAGYEVRTPWRVLNASSYGVPQDRERLFLLGSRRGSELPYYPAEITRRRTRNQLLSKVPPVPSCREALADLPNADDFVSLLDHDSVHTKKWGEPSEYARLLRCTDDEGWFLGHRRRFDPYLLTSSARTTHTDITRLRFTETKGGCVEPISRFFKLDAEGISNTLRAGTDAARGAFTSPRPIHYKHPRCITVREMARLHGFPDWFRFHATKWHGARQIGNSVPPPLARAVARMVAQALGYAPMFSEHTIVLGDENWLTTTTAEAACLLGVDPPNGRRDQKSGVKKRSQQETEAERLSVSRQKKYKSTKSEAVSP